MKQRRAITLLLSLLLVVVVALSVFLVLNRSTNTPKPKSSSHIPASQADEPSAKPVILYYVAIGDNGQSGGMIGCGDSIVPVVIEETTEKDLIKTTFDRLLSNHERNYHDSKLYNPLYSSSLTYVNSIKTTDKVVVNLSGDFGVGGVCDIPRIQAQLEFAAKTAMGVRNAEIFVDSKPLNEVLSLK